MKLKSLGCRTDIMVCRMDGEIHERENYIVVKTPRSPNYFWGNYIIFSEPPKRNDLPLWKNIFDDEFCDPRIYHYSFSWDSPEGNFGETREFVEAGFQIEKGVVLSTSKVQLPLKFNSKIEVRPITTDEEWREEILLQAASGYESLSFEHWLKFCSNQSLRYRRMVAAGYGVWLGAFLDAKLVGCLGVFKEGNLGRYQSVATHPDFRRLGVCSSLVYHAAKIAFDKMECETLVMVADEDYHAARVYESVGFLPTEKYPGLCWWDKQRA